MKYRSEERRRDGGYMRGVEIGRKLDDKKTLIERGSKRRRGRKRR